jgi:hypothetical protein
LDEIKTNIRPGSLLRESEQGTQFHNSCPSTYPRTSCIDLSMCMYLQCNDRRTYLDDFSEVRIYKKRNHSNMQLSNPCHGSH